MRDILFKAKTFNGKWVQGLLAHKDNKWYISNKAGMPFAFEVRPDTICQYTGLKDKNGNKIWENDIVELYDTNNNYKWKAIVKFGNPNATYNWGYQLHPIGEYKVNTDILLWVEMEDTGTICEVIGNIFDNPELLNYVDNDVSQ